MLRITVPEFEIYNEDNDEFIAVKSQVLKLEHSLISMSKWESKWHKPFLVDNERTSDEAVSYIKCMTLNQNIDEMVYLGLTKENFDAVNGYIEDSMTATWFNENKTPSSKKIMTSEVIYAQMFKLNIPLECEKWHLNRLMTLLRVCAIESSPEKEKMSKSEILKQNRELNEKRRAAAKTKG